MSSAVPSAGVASVASSASGADSTGAGVQSSAAGSSAASSIPVSSPEMSSAASTSEPMSSSAASSDAAAESSASSAPRTSSRAEGTISGAGGTIKAGAGLALPTKLDGWVRSTNSGIYFYKKGGLTITAGFLAGADYTGIQGNVEGRRTKVGSGVCGWTHDPENQLCYLKTADGVINLNAEGTDTPLVALVDFADQLTKTLGTT